VAGAAQSTTTLWRLSLADLTADGPFSSFPLLDRQFLVTSPDPVALLIGRSIHRIGFGEVLRFPGEAQTRVTGLANNGSALNLMTQRDLCTGSLEVVRSHHGPLELDGTDLTAVILIGGSLRLGDLELDRHDVLLPGSLPLRVDADNATLVTVKISADVSSRIELPPTDGGAPHAVEHASRSCDADTPRELPSWRNT
jgi:environmental stress-induced protein Ves